MSACGSGGGDALITNADDAFTVAAEAIADPTIAQDFTHGTLTVENATDSALTLTGVRLSDVVGDIEIVEAYVVPTGRPVLWVSSSDEFPPRSENDSLLTPLAGFVVAPFPRGEGKERNVEVVLHLRVPPGQQYAGYGSLCIEFSAGGEVGAERCAAHAFYACTDLQAPDCPADESS